MNRILDRTVGVGLVALLAVIGSIAPLVGDERGGSQAEQFAAVPGQEDARIQADPGPPTLVAPAPDGVIWPSVNPVLEVTVTDPDADLLDVTFYGREAIGEPGEEFSIIHMTDLQLYAQSYPATYTTMTQWIRDNRDNLNIVFSTLTGDIVNTASSTTQWINADAALDILDPAYSPEYPDGVPYGVLPGNHDVTDGLVNYNNYFGVERFIDKGWYGGWYDDADSDGVYNVGETNNNHFDLFSGGGMDFIAIHLEWEVQNDPNVLAWVDDLLVTYSGRRAIIASHYLMEVGENGPLSVTGQAIYDTIVGHPNVFMMLCGHKHGEGKRVDTGTLGNDIVTMVADYQDYPNGGDGNLRILQFKPADDEIHVFTYSPVLDAYITDSDSQFVLPYDMSGGPSFQNLGTVTGVASGANAQMPWNGRQAGSSYEWYVEISDGTTTTTGPIWTFTAACTGDGECDDGNLCTIDQCNGGLCEHSDDDGAWCDDGDFCTSLDSCLGGACQPGASTSCPVGQTCDPGTGNCRTDPVVVTFQQSVDGYAGAVDTYGESGDATSNATAPILRWDGSPSRFGLLRFERLFDSESPPGPIPAGVPILSATLYYENDNDAGNNANLHEVVIDWTDSVLYENFGGDAGVQADEYDPAVVTVAPSFPVGPVDVTTSLQSWSDDPTGNRGWVFLPTGDSGVSIRSSDYATATQRPRLTVTYASCVLDSDCDDGDPCTADACVGNLCEYSLADTTPCDDGDLCTENDACLSGACVGAAVDCSTLDDACNAGVCDGADGSCDAIPINEGGACDDGVACTAGDVCAAGLCAGSDGCPGGQYCDALLDICIAATTLTLPDGLQHCEGGSLRVPIDATGLAGVLSMEFQFGYDPAVLLATEVLTAGLTTDLALSYDLSTAGVVQLSMIGAAPVNGDGPVAWVAFDVVGAAPSSSDLTWLQALLDGSGVIAFDGSVSVVAAQSVVSLPDDAIAGPGQNVVVPLTATPAMGSGLDFKVEFDPGVLQVADVRKTSISLGHTLTSNSSQPGVAIISLFSSSSLTGSGPIIEIEFTVVGSLGQSSPLLFTRAQIDEGLVTTCADDGWFVACEEPPEVRDSLILDKVAGETLLSWDDEGIVTDYRLYRGEIISGEPFEYNQTCWGAPIEQPSTTDPLEPPEDHAVFYVVARETVCGRSELHRDSEGAPIPDLNPCP